MNQRYVDVSRPPYSVNSGMDPSDQRKGIQRAWDDVSAAGGGIVVLPDMYTVDRATEVTEAGTTVSDFYCLRARDNVATWGVDQLSSGLRMATDTAAQSVMLVSTGPVDTPGGASNVSFARLTLDGNKAGNAPAPQRHCLFLQEATNVLCDQVRFVNAPGDGVYHHDSTHETAFHDCLFVGSGRNGITLTRANHNVKISRCRFRAIRAQQIDCEAAPGHVPFDIVVEGCTFEHGVGEGDFVVSVQGFSGSDADRPHDWRFVGNRFEGAVNVTWARDIAFSGNSWVIEDETYRKPCLLVYRTSERVAVTGNTFASTVDCLRLEATSGDGQQPRYVTIDSNTFVLLDRTGPFLTRTVVDASGGPGEYVFSNNTVLGPSDGSGVALHHRPTRHNKSAIIRGNIVRQCQFGFRLDAATGDDRFERIVVDGNTFDPGVVPTSFPVILKHDEPHDGPVIDDFILANNIWTGAGVVPVAWRDKKTTAFVAYEGGQVWRTDGSAGMQATYSCAGSPVGTFDAPIGSMAIRRDGSPGSTLYVKEAPTAAGWVAK